MRSKETRSVTSIPAGSRLALCGMLFVLGVCILSLALPALREALLVQQLSQINNTLYQDETPSNQEVADAYSAYQSRRSTRLSPHQKAELAMLFITTAKRVGTQSLFGLDSLFKAKELLQSSLADSPANSFAWARYTYVSQVLNGDTPQTRAAWLMSIYTAAFEPKLVLWRIECAASWKAPLSAEENQLFEQQVFYALRVRNSLTLKLLAKINRPDLLSRFLETVSAEERRTNENGYRYFREQLQNQPER